MHMHPQSGEKNKRNLQGKFVSAPQHTKYTTSLVLGRAVNFGGHFLLGGGDLESFGGESGTFSSFRPTVEGDD